MAEGEEKRGHAGEEEVGQEEADGGDGDFAHMPCVCRVGSVPRRNAWEGARCPDSCPDHCPVVDPMAVPIGNDGWVVGWVGE